jgi:CDP-paratose synthetase
MKIILTGATGFLGLKLLEYLIKEGHYVVIIIRDSTNTVPLKKIYPNLKTYNINQLEILYNESSGIDVIIHAATNYGRDSNNPTETFWSNEFFPMKLLKFGMDFKVPLFLNVDTFYNSKSKVQYNYLGSYTLSKKHFQEWGMYCANMKKISFSNLRLFHLYGPGDAINKFIPSIVKKILYESEIDLTSGEQSRDFINIKDAISAIGIILNNNYKKKTLYRHYEIGNGTSITIKELILIIKKISKSSVQLNFGILPKRKGEFFGESAKNYSLHCIGWRPVVTIEEGLIEVINYMSNSNIK